MLFRALLGLVPYQGIISWKPGIHIGYVPQKLFVDRSLPVTVREFFLLKSNRFWNPEKSYIEHLDHELDLVAVKRDILNKPLGELSGGQLQRLLVAWAMLNHPDVLLLDEPTAGVDIGYKETLYQVMHRLQQERGTTVLLISHDLNVVYRYAQQVICLNKTLVCQGRPTEVLSQEELSKVYGESGFYHHEGSPSH
jgi:ABC-type Mn2+/Zn2+ transport system ATPase subunit